MFKVNTFILNKEKTKQTISDNIEFYKKRIFMLEKILFDEIKQYLIFKETDYENIKKYNSNNNMIDFKKELEKNIDISSLITLVHFKSLNIQIKKIVNDYVSYIYFLNGVNVLNYLLVNLLSNNIENYCFNIKKSEKNNIDIDANIKFNIGLIIVNLIIIKWRYKDVKKTNK